MMTNKELADAIAYAVPICDAKLGGFGAHSATSEVGKVMLEHLKRLLQIQAERAGKSEETTKDKPTLENADYQYKSYGMTLGGEK